jgi:ATP-dependent DNA helicase RecQ
MSEEDVSHEKAALIFTPNVNGEYGCYYIFELLKKKGYSNVTWFSGKVPQRTIYEENGTRRENVLNDEDFKKHKQQAQKDFKNNIYQILIATKSFGMGIDKQNIFYTFHYGLPSSVEALYQEAGRAGRWDRSKDDNRNKIAKCFILYTPETKCPPERVNSLFELNTTFTQIREVQNEVGRDGKDIFKQFYLFIQNQRDIEEDIKIILEIINRYFKKEVEQNTSIKIYWSEVREKLKIDKNVLEKEIYRLSLLGIISDWTTDFINYYEVEFNSLNSENILNNLSTYIKKYDTNKDVKNEIEKTQGNTFLEKAIRYLLNWIFEEIIYNRKQSLKNLLEWCSEFKDNESFKQKVNDYFKISERTFIFQYIAEKPREYEKWFEVLKIEILLQKGELESLKNSISRFLESYHSNIGLNFLSGFIRLALNNYEDSDGKERFEKALSEIKKIPEEQQNIIFNRIVEYGEKLEEEEQKWELSQSLLKYYPDKRERLADIFNLPYLFNEIYEKNLNKLKNINQKLYEPFTKI